jgi:hypothetical protein
MARYPMGGNLSWTLQWLVGFQRLGHQAYLVEKAHYPGACWDPSRGVMGDDCSYGVATVHQLLARFGLGERWCFVDLDERYHGLSRHELETVFGQADLFVDIGSHGAWSAESTEAGLRVLVDGEPGYSQIKMERRRAAGEVLPEYDFYYSNGANVGTPRSNAPTAGRAWRPLFNPVVVDLLEPVPPPDDAPFTTVMNWASHDPIEFQGIVYGQKDLEFEKFIELPQRTGVPLEAAIAGKRAPRGRLKEHGWRVRDGHEVSASFDSYASYLRASRGEFSVCKNVFVVMNSGWFSDRSAAYLASGRPVVLQETGFSDHLPCGRGLFAVRSPDEAAAALDEIQGNYQRHAKWARDLAREYLDARVVLGRLLRELGI